MHGVKTPIRLAEAAHPASSGDTFCSASNVFGFALNVLCFDFRRASFGSECRTVRCLCPEDNQPQAPERKIYFVTIVSASCQETAFILLRISLRKVDS